MVSDKDNIQWFSNHFKWFWKKLVCQFWQLQKQHATDMQVLCKFKLCVCVCTDWQQSRGKSSLYRRPVRSVVIIFTLTELMCLEPISLIRAITLVKACTEKTKEVRTVFELHKEISAVVDKQHLSNCPKSKKIWMILAINNNDFYWHLI